MYPISFILFLLIGKNYEFYDSVLQSLLTPTVNDILDLAPLWDNNTTTAMMMDNATARRGKTRHDTMYVHGGDFLNWF